MKKPSLNFTDLKLLKTIQKEYANSYFNRGKQKERFYTQIDCNLIAKKMMVDEELVFQRLYTHLEKRYGYKNDDGSNIHFFALKAGDKTHCINYPYLCAVLANMKDEKKELRITQAIAFTSHYNFLLLHYLLKLIYNRWRYIKKD
jgi:hypothetical protein